MGIVTLRNGHKVTFMPTNIARAILLASNKGLEGVSKGIIISGIYKISVTPIVACSTLPGICIISLNVAGIGIDICMALVGHKAFVVCV